MKILKSIKLCLALVLLAIPLLVHSWPAKLSSVTFEIYENTSKPLKGPVYFFDGHRSTNRPLYPLFTPILTYHLFNESPENGRTQFDVQFYYLNYKNILNNMFHSSGKEPSINFAIATINIDRKEIYKGRVIKSDKEAEEIVNKAVKCENISNTVNMNGRKVSLTAYNTNPDGYVQPEIILNLDEEHVDIEFTCHLEELTTEEEQTNKLKNDLGVKGPIGQKFTGWLDL